MRIYGTNKFEREGNDSWLTYTLTVYRHHSDGLCLAMHEYHTGWQEPYDETRMVRLDVGFNKDIATAIASMLDDATSGEEDFMHAYNWLMSTLERESEDTPVEIDRMVRDNLGVEGSYQHILDILSFYETPAHTPETS